MIICAWGFGIQCSNWLCSVINTLSRNKSAFNFSYSLIIEKNQCLMDQCLWAVCPFNKGMSQSFREPPNQWMYYRDGCWLDEAAQSMALVNLGPAIGSMSSPHLRTRLYLTTPWANKHRKRWFCVVLCLRRLSLAPTREAHRRNTFTRAFSPFWFHVTYAHL